MIKRRLPSIIFAALAMLLLHGLILAVPAPALAQGATQIDGVGYSSDGVTCDIAGMGADLALEMTGDLEGCLFGFVETATCSPSGVYRETGTELFVGTYMGEAGTFGRCQHPLIAGSGTGVFAGASGRLDFKDDIEAGNFPYRGHLRW